MNRHKHTVIGLFTVNSFGTPSECRPDSIPGSIPAGTGGGGWIIRAVFLEGRTHLAGTRVRLPPDALGPALASHLADPAVIAAMVNHDGQLWIERIDGRTVRAAAPMPRGE